MEAITKSEILKINKLLNLIKLSSENLLKKLWTFKKSNDELCTYI